MHPVVSRAWNSPTLTTWASFGARALNLVFILPWILKRFDPAEVALWQVITTLMSLQMLADLGFGPTLSRLIAYAMGGAKSFDEIRPREPNSKVEPNWGLVEQTVSTLRAIQNRLGWLLGLLLIVGGTLALLKRVDALSGIIIPPGSPARTVTTTREAWGAWAVVVCVSIVSFRANTYSIFLQGTNHVALNRRWEALCALGSIATGATALGLHAGIGVLIIINQGWVAFAAWRNNRLARSVFDGRFRNFPKPKLHPELVQHAWPAAWRTVLGAFMSLGVMQISGILVAQNKDSAKVASYLIGVRLVQLASQLSQAPYYSKLPTLAALYSQNQIDKLLTLAKRGMGLSYWSFLLPVTILAFWGDTILLKLGSRTPFPELPIWVLLAAGTFVERYAAMHIQLYTLTNHIVWHIANGVSGLIFIAIGFAGYPLLGVTAVPLAMLLSNCLFFAPFSSYKAHTAFKLKFPIFDFQAGFQPVRMLMHWGK